MKEILIKIIVISYGATAVVDILAYLPTIKDLYKHKKPSANVTSYWLWTTTTGTGFLYSLFILPDLLFRLVSGAMFLSNLLILVLIIRLQSNKSTNIHN